MTRDRLLNSDRSARRPFAVANRKKKRSLGWTGPWCKLPYESKQSPLEECYGQVGAESKVNLPVCKKFPYIAFTFYSFGIFYLVSVPQPRPWARYLTVRPVGHSAFKLCRTVRRPGVLKTVSYPISGNFENQPVSLSVIERELHPL